MSLFNVEKALVLCPHTDDEFGCAATVRRLVQDKVQVHYVALSRCEESVPEGFHKTVLEEECRAGTASLGIAPENVQVWDFKVRYFPENRQEILERFVKLNRALKPQLVLLPTSHDRHQDHATVSAEGFRAFKHATLLGYELPQNTVTFETSTFVPLEEEHIESKIRAMACYKSQAFRTYASAEVIRSLATVRGMQCNAKYAEAFEPMRIIFR